MTWLFKVWWIKYPPNKLHVQKLYAENQFQTGQRLKIQNWGRGPEVTSILQEKDIPRKQLWFRSYCYQYVYTFSTMNSMNYKHAFLYSNKIVAYSKPSI